MKKILLVLLFAFLLFPVVSSADIQMKDELKRGETLVAKIEGSFTEPPKESGIYFMFKGSKVPFDTNLVGYKGDYFLSAQISDERESGNYTLIIEDAEYLVEGGQESSEDIVKEFRISEDYADFSTRPAVLGSSNGSFSLEIENLQSEELTIDANKEGPSRSFSEESNESWSFSSWFSSSEDNSSEFSPESSFSIGAFETETFNFEFEDVSARSLQTMSLSTENFGQEIFVYVSQGSGTSDEPEDEKNDSEGRLNFEQNSFDFNMSANSSVERVLRLENTGNSDLNDVVLSIDEDSFDRYVNLSVYNISLLEVNETEEVVVNINYNDSVEEFEEINGTIEASASNGNYNDYVGFSVGILPASQINQSEESGETVGNESDLATEDRTCFELNGTVCEPDQTCDGETVEAANGRCCLSNQCVAEDEGGISTGQIIGWGILALLVGVYIWFYFKKYKKTKNKPNLDKYTKDTKKK